MIRKPWMIEKLWMKKINIHKAVLTLSSPADQKQCFANGVNPDQMACDERFHQYLPLCAILFLVLDMICL